MSQGAYLEVFSVQLVPSHAASVGVLKVRRPPPFVTLCSEGPAGQDP